MGNITAGNEEQTKLIINLEVLDLFTELLLRKNDAIRKEVLWALSNILAGSRDLVSAVCNRFTLLLIFKAMDDKDLR